MMKIFEVDEHHHVLRSQTVQKAVGEVLVNFDSHEDLGVSATRNPSDVDVGTWILPPATRRKLLEADLGDRMG